MTPRPDTSTIFELLEQSRRRARVPGMGAALVPAAGPPIIAVAGERVRGGDDPVTITDRWHIGSCMKAMTAATVARFVERGELHWSTPVSELFEASEYADRGWREVPVADVLTHVAGVPANPPAAELRAALTDHTPLPEQRARLAERTLRQAPDRPGRFRYSNTGYVLVGAALERLTGAPFEEVLTAELLHPLGITSAGFGPPEPGQPQGHRGRWVAGGLGLGAGPAIEPTSASLIHPPDNPPLLTPAGRLHLNLADWAAFVRCYLTGPDRMLSPRSLERLTTPPAGVATEQGMGWAVPTRGRLRGRVAYVQQGSNARWVATAAIAADRSLAALVVCNDGRTRMLGTTLRLATDLLAPHGKEWSAATFVTPGFGRGPGAGRSRPRDGSLPD